MLSCCSPFSFSLLQQWRRLKSLSSTIVPFHRVLSHDSRCRQLWLLWHHHDALSWTAMIDLHLPWVPRQIVDDDNDDHVMWIYSPVHTPSSCHMVVAPSLWHYLPSCLIAGTESPFAGLHTCDPTFYLRSADCILGCIVWTWSLQTFES